LVKVHVGGQGNGTFLNLKETLKNTIKNLMINYSKEIEEDTQNNDNENEISDSDSEEDIGMDVYDKFMDYIDSIYEGKFFERIPIEDKKRKLKTIYTENQIRQMNSELDTIQKNYAENAPSITEILKMDINLAQKQKLLEKVYHYVNSDVLTSEYNSNLKFLKTNLKQYDDSNLQELENKILSASQSLEFSDNYKEKILRSNMPFQNKVIAYKRLEIMEAYEESDSSEYAKYKNWMDILLSIPYDKNIVEKCENNDVKTYVKKVRTILDERLSFLEKPKDQIINVVTQMIRNPEFNVNAIGLYGVKGVGKTQIIKSISEALNRPYRSISLGGESDSSLLTGHHFTYVGSCPGRIIEILRETKCTNPIILFDELDKVSETHHGKEIIGNLIHLTDSTTNNKYNYDKYFSGIDFDLSNVLFVFTYNDPMKVDKILADRLLKIRVENYTFKEKLEITNKHLIKNVLQEYNFTEDTILFTEECINHIVQTSKSDEGMRDIKRKIEIIISRINTLLLTDADEDIIRLKYKCLYNYYNTNNLPVNVLREHVDIFLSDTISNETNEKPPPFGMYI
jgi:ATP-dependent Lon protease